MSGRAQIREDPPGLADEQAALRRVAELVAEGASQPRVFDAVAREACRLLGGHFTALLRYEPDGPAVIMAMWGDEAVRHVVHVGMRLAEDGEGLVKRVQRFGRAERIDSYDGVPGANAATARKLDLTSGVGAPIITDGRVWGAITVLAQAQPLPSTTEARLGRFARLVATAVSDAQARSEVRELADEQAALRRVAELVAREAPREEVFAAVATEASSLLQDEAMTLTRFDSDTSLSVVATCGGPASVGTRIAFRPDTLPDRVRQTKRAVRVDDYTLERDARLAAEYGLVASVAAPISVQGNVWGMLTATSDVRPLPADTARRLHRFAELAGTAIANAQARAQVHELADEQAALRRVAELVARGAPRADVLDSVVAEACRLVGAEYTTLGRFASDGSSTLVATHKAPNAVGVGDRQPPGAPCITQEVRRTGRIVRIEDYEGRSAEEWERACELGVTAGAAAPILVEGRLWGALSALTLRESMPAGIENRLAQFAELAGIAISGAHARDELRNVATEQAALRRVAELVARDVAQEDLFATVASEASKLTENEATTLLRFDDDGSATVLAACRGLAPIGARFVVTPEDDSTPGKVLRTGRPARHDGYAGADGPTYAREFGVGSSVGAPIVVEDRVWGMLGTTTPDRRLPVEAEQRLQQFAELVAAALANAQARAQIQHLADEQTALRRIAELTTQEATADAVLQAVAVQASRLAGVEFGMVLRFVAPDGTSEIVALDGAPPNFELGMRASGSGDGSVHRVWRTGRAARVDDLGAMSGRWPQMATRFGFSASAGVPILLQGRLWGALIVAGRDAMSPAIEAHLADFAALVGTAISATQARAELRALADEQAALRRVAELVARGAALGEVFAALATEASKLLGDQAAVLLRYDPGDLAVAVAVCNSPVPLGLHIPSGTGTATGEVLRTGRAVRVDSFEGTQLAGLAQELDVQGGVAVPILVEGRVWGALTTSTSGPPLPSDAEDRLAQFAELAAAAIANAENKAKLTASRARVIATADETRRRLQRDLHDGAQQRLVHTLISLKLARDAAPAGHPAAALIEEALAHAERTNSELRDLVRGILPASLTRGGLRAGVESLVADLTVPVDIRVTVPRLHAQLETTAYFIVAEALTNVVKHADATRATVEAVLDGDRITITVQDDGRGGADAAHGTGLTGLLDRVEATEGQLDIISPRGGGTTLRATLSPPEAAAAD